MSFDLPVSGLELQQVAIFSAIGHVSQGFAMVAWHYSIQTSLTQRAIIFLDG